MHGSRVVVRGKVMSTLADQCCAGFGQGDDILAAGMWCDLDGHHPCRDGGVRSVD